MATLTQFRSAVANMVGLDNTVSGDQGDIDRWVNEAVVRVSLDCRPYVTSQTVTPGATADYTLASSVIDVMEMYTTSGGIDSRLERLTPADIISLRIQASGTGPARYYALAGASTVMFYPTPAASDTVTMYYVPSPTALSTGSDDPSTASKGGIPVEYHKAIEYWACGCAADQDDDQTSSQGQRYRDMYNQEIGRIRKLMRRKGGHRLAPFTVNPRRRRVVPGDPSADVR